MKILIVKIGAIGDIVMAMPLLTHLHKKYEKVSITWVCGAQVSSLLEHTGLVDELIIVNDELFLKGSIFDKIWIVAKVWRKLLGRVFDLCLIPYADPRYGLFSLASRCRQKKSFYRGPKGLFPIPGRYHGYEYLRLEAEDAEPLELIPQFPTLSLPTVQPGHKLRVVLAPGGARNLLADSPLRRWPIEHYVKLIKLLEKLSMEIVITGSGSDTWVMEYFSGMTYTNLIGKLSLIELVTLLKETTLLITHDSGPLHLGKLVSCPTLALFGPTNPSEFIGPHENITVLWGGESLFCRPCYDGKKYAKCIKNRCLEMITPQVVFETAVKIMQSRGVNIEV